VDLQPGEQVVVLGVRQVARQRLVEVVVRVHESGQDDLASEIEDMVGGRRKLGRRCDLLDDSVARKQASVGEFAARAVHGHERRGVADEQGWHHGNREKTTRHSAYMATMSAAPVGSLRLAGITGVSHHPKRSLTQGTM
jgi:hypothetical protein